AASTRAGRTGTILAPAPALATTRAAARNARPAAEGRRLAVVHGTGESGLPRSSRARPHTPAARRLRQALAAAHEPRDALEMRVARTRLPLVIDFVRSKFPLFLGLGAV